MRIGASESVVVDASFIVKLLVNEEDSYLAEALVQTWDNDGIRMVAPHLLHYEVSNVLHQKVRAGQMTVQDAAGLIEDLVAHGIELFSANVFHENAIQLASRFNRRAVYDSHYLALALALDCDFWTADERFYQSVTDNVPKVRLITEAAAPNQ